MSCCISNAAATVLIHNNQFFLPFGRQRKPVSLHADRVYGVLRTMISVSHVRVTRVFALIKSHVIKKKTNKQTIRGCNSNNRSCFHFSVTKR